MTSQERFLNLLTNEILKLDLAELDFGIYRILKYKRDQIDQLLNKDLQSRIAEIAEQQSASKIDVLKERISDDHQKLDELAMNLGLKGAFDGDSMIPELADLPIGVEALERRAELERLESEAGFSKSEEDDIYHHLFTFLSRYYSDGDFQTQMRRSRKAPYTVPYLGQDVHYYWKGYGTHYSKTAEELKKYTFTIPKGKLRIQFETVAATMERDNVKGETKFFHPLLDQSHTSKKDKIFIIPFEFRELTTAESKKLKGSATSVQEKLITNALDGYKDKLPTGLTRTTLEYHLLRYAKKHQTDYFIHPNLGEFLIEELEYYLKNEYLQFGGLTGFEEIRDRFLKFEVLRDIGKEIINILDQIESFQASLFEKRKFVLETSYLIPLRHIDQALWEEVLENQDQIRFWHETLGLESKITTNTLATHPTLVVNTSFFADSPDFILKALAGFENLDEAISGTLVHAENYAALRTLDSMFRNEVKLIYIDPPYNTGKDEFLYKDEFSRHSTWLSMMFNRLRLGYDFLKEDGVFFASIDDNEQHHLRELLDKLYGDSNRLSTLIWDLGTGTTAGHFTRSHEYILSYTKNKDALPNFTGGEGVIRHGALKKISAKNPPSPITFPKGMEYEGDSRTFTGTIGGSETMEIKGKMVFENGKLKKGVTITAGWAMKNQVISWLEGKETYDSKGQRVLRFFFNPEGILYYEKERTRMNPKTVISDVGSTKVGSQALTNLFGEKVMNFPKPVELLEFLIQLVVPQTAGREIIMDYFAGSGTTAHAVINLNRKDGGNRRFIMIEMADYFDSILLPRIAKLMYSPGWKDGEPLSKPIVKKGTDDSKLDDWIQNSPTLVKVIRLESYEDSLNALELPEEYKQRKEGQTNLVDDELQYQLNLTETGSSVMLDTEQLETPFDYKLRIHTTNGEQLLPVDLVETANLLLGLRVKRIHGLLDGKRRYVICEAFEANSSVLVIWRNIEGLDPTKEREFLKEHFDLDEFDSILSNADSLVSKGSRILDAELKKALLSADPGVPR